MHNNTPKKCPTDIFFQLTAELQRKAESKEREKKGILDTDVRR